MKSSHIWTIVGISLIVAIFASFATMSITGNVIVKTDNSRECSKICTSSCKNVTVGSRSISCYNKCYDSCIVSAPLVDVYTKKEIDSKINNLVTYPGVLNMLNNCNIYSVSIPSANRTVTGDEICKERNVGKCIFTVNYENLNDAVNNNVALLGSNAGIIESCKFGPYKSTDAVAYCCPFY